MTADRDQALIEEAVKRARLALGSADGWDGDDWDSHLARTALELERSGWRPTDPDVLAVRAVIAEWENGLTTLAISITRGERDESVGFRNALAAYRKHKGGAHG